MKHPLFSISLLASVALFSASPLLARSLMGEANVGLGVQYGELDLGRDYPIQSQLDGFGVFGDVNVPVMKPRDNFPIGIDVLVTGQHFDVSGELEFAVAERQTVVDNRGREFLLTDVSFATEDFEISETEFLASAVFYYELSEYARPAIMIGGGYVFRDQILRTPEDAAILTGFDSSGFPTFVPIAYFDPEDPTDTETIADPNAPRVDLEAPAEIFFPQDENSFVFTVGFMLDLTIIPDRLFFRPRYVFTHRPDYETRGDPIRVSDVVDASVLDDDLDDAEREAILNAELANLFASDTNPSRNFGRTEADMHEFGGEMFVWITDQVGASLDLTYIQSDLNEIWLLGAKLTYGF